MLIPMLALAQERQGRVFDAKTRDGLPFATVKFGSTGKGTVAGLDGRFEIPADIAGIVSSIEITSLGYEPQQVQLIKKKLEIYLQPQDNALIEVTVTPPYDKMRRIINNAIDNKSRNNPDKYDWYRCHVYYKMVADFTVPDSTLSDTSADDRETKDFMENQHLLMTETYSIRTWRKPQQLQEQVIAARFSGFKKSLLNGLVTDVLPFHAYTDYITLNGKDYHNPISRGFEQHYRFNLVDEVQQGADTIWALSFRPRSYKGNTLKGVVYITSHGYAISRITAEAHDTLVKMRVRIEQQYEEEAAPGGDTRWFPRHLNYIIDWQGIGKTKTNLFMKGNSRIDSVTFTEDENFRFDKRHTVKMTPGADMLPDSTWKAIRPDTLDAKERRTYRVIDSFGQAIKLDKYAGYIAKLPEGKVPIGPLDLDVKRIISGNKYEKIRLGIGLQTNEKIIKWLSVGGWAGYGFRDVHWKYGAFAEVYADKYKEFVFRAGYTDDISDPGRVRLHRDIDKGYLKMYLLQRVDNTRTWNVSVRKKLGYVSLELEGRQQEIIPKYAYALDYPSESFSTFKATEASLSFRYAYAERTAPFFGYYGRTGNRYPVLYGRITQGNVAAGQTMNTAYTQALAAVLWHKHINRIGFEHILIEGGKSWSDNTLPLSKLFVGQGFRYDTKSSIQQSAYTFGGMMTIYPYEYYTDQFVMFIYRHDFDWKLYKLDSRKALLSSAPNICLQYNMLYGTLNDRNAHKLVAFSVPDNAYHEAGMLLNNIIRYRYLNLYYLTLNMGYFYHVTDGPFDAKMHGKMVMGLGIEF